MKRFWVFAMLMMVLAACRGSAAPGGGQCNQGLCVKIEVAEPIHWGEPLLVQISVVTKDDASNLGISLIYHDKGIVVEEPKKVEQGEVVWKGDQGLDWRVSAKANQPVVLTHRVHLPPREGSIQFIASAITPQGLQTVDSVRIYLTREGGRVYYANTPVPTSPLDMVALGRVRTSEGVHCSPGPCLTIRVVEPVRWGEPVRVLLQVEGNKQENVYSFPSGPITVPADFPQLGLTFFSPDPSVQTKPEKGEFKEQRLWPGGNGVWWVADVWANSTQEYTFLVTFPQKEGIYRLNAESFDPRFGQVVSTDGVGIELSREGGKVFAPSLGTPFPTATPWPTPLPTPTFPPPMYTPAPTQPPYPPISPISPIATPTPAAYP